MIDKYNEILEKLKIEAYNGEFYWRARDIQFLLENSNWKKLKNAILNIEKTCKKQGLDTSKDIIATKTTINDGTSKYLADDFYVSNLIAQQLFYEFNTPKNKKQKINFTTQKFHIEKKKLSLRSYILIGILSLIILAITSVTAIFYLPLQPLREIRNLYIATAMTTYTHQWLATSFFSEETINEVMSENIPDDFEINSDSINFYVDENTIEIVDIKGSNYVGKLLKISNPSKVKIAISNNYGTRGQFLEELVEQNDAVAGINGSGFIDDEGKGKAAFPVGILIKDGKIIYDPGYSEYDIVGFDNHDNLVVGTYTKDEIKELKIRDAVEPFYKLTINGKDRIKSGNGGYGLHPRTAIGQTSTGTVLMLVIDGRQLHSIGATMKDCQDILKSYGAINSAALDGGSSSIMYYDGGIQTKPSNGTTYGRYLPSAFVVYE